MANRFLIAQLRRVRILCKCFLWIFAIFLVAVIAFAKHDRAFRIKLKDLQSDGVNFARQQFRNSGAKKSKQISPTITLFTTFREFDALRLPLHTYVIKNWAMMKPHVKPIVFYDDPKHQLNRLASNYGWNIHPIPRSNEHGTPFIRDMYKAAMDMYKSDFYAYANGDLLFSANLIESVRAVQLLLDRDEDLGPPLIIGRRSNYVMDFNKPEPSLHKPEVVQKKTAKPFTNFAIDYFIIQDKFPWDSMLDLVIGRGGYDQYMVLMAVINGMTVVDTTPSNRVLHLQGSNFNLTSRTADNIDKKYNLNLIRGVHDGHLPPTGSIAMSKAVTFKTKEGVSAMVKGFKQYKDDYQAVHQWCRTDAHMKRIGQKSKVFAGYSED